MVWISTIWPVAQPLCQAYYTSFDLKFFPPPWNSRSEPARVMLNCNINPRHTSEMLFPVQTLFLYLLTHFLLTYFQLPLYEVLGGFWACMSAVYRNGPEIGKVIPQHPANTHWLSTTESTTRPWAYSTISPAGTSHLLYQLMAAGRECENGALLSPSAGKRRRAACYSLLFSHLFWALRLFNSISIHPFCRQSSFTSFSSSFSHTLTEKRYSMGSPISKAHVDRYVYSNSIVCVCFCAQFTRNCSMWNAHEVLSVFQVNKLKFNLNAHWGSTGLESKPWLH